MARKRRHGKVHRGQIEIESVVLDRKGLSGWARVGEEAPAERDRKAPRATEATAEPSGPILEESVDDVDSDLDLEKRGRPLPGHGHGKFGIVHDEVAAVINGQKL